MHSNNNPHPMPVVVVQLPSLSTRLFSVWFRHMMVYKKNLWSNGFPPFIEPLIFMVGIGLGLGTYVDSMDGVPYIQFLIPGLLVAPAMFTASFECTFGTFIRLKFDKAYDGMLGAPLTVENLLVGEILWAGTKSMFFTSAVLCVVSLLGFLSFSTFFFAPFIGLITGFLFGSIALLYTSFISNINQINFFITGFLSPMFFFSGIVFPLTNLSLFIPMVG